MNIPITIYRLEDDLGKGPFESSLKQPSIGFHENPIDLLKQSKITKKKFNELMKLNYKFGWSNEDLYLQMFAGHNDKIKKKNESKAYKNGFKKSIYICTDYYLLSDGQVIFT